MAGLFAGKLINIKNLNVDRYLHLQYIRIDNHQTSSEIEDSGFMELSDELIKHKLSGFFFKFCGILKISEL